jgi:CheY-like chemotaxis protein
MPAILVVDDDASIRAMFARALERLGDVEVAVNGDDALSKLSAKAYDAVTLDLAMPKVDGFAVLESLSAPSAKNHHTPVIVITANPQDQAMTKVFHAGAMLFLTKPAAIGQLVVMVQMALQKKSKK